MLFILHDWSATGPYTLPHWAVHTTPLGRTHHPTGPYTLPHWAVHTTPMGRTHYPTGPYTPPHWAVRTTPLGRTHYPTGPYTLPQWAVHTTPLGRTHYPTRHQKASPTALQTTFCIENSREDRKPNHGREEDKSPPGSLCILFIIYLLIACLLPGCVVNWAFIAAPGHSRLRDDPRVRSHWL